MKINKLTPGYNLRWESSRMMLPEHREQLLKEKRKNEEFHPPILDEEELQEINRIMIESINKNQTVIITYAGKYGPQQSFGRIRKVNTIEGSLTIMNDKDTFLLSFNKILRVEISEFRE